MKYEEFKSKFPQLSMCGKSDVTPDGATFFHYDDVANNCVSKTKIKEYIDGLKWKYSDLGGNHTNEDTWDLLVDIEKELTEELDDNIFFNVLVNQIRNYMLNLHAFNPREALREQYWRKAVDELCFALKDKQIRKLHFGGF